MAATARSWRWRPRSTGRPALEPVTAVVQPARGQSSDDGGRGAEPAVRRVDTITWSFVVLDAAGHQVGTGAAKLTNNDPANPASTVAFAIKEIPAAVDATTVFTRDGHHRLRPTLTATPGPPRRPTRHHHSGGRRGDGRHDRHPARAWPAWCGSRTTGTTCGASRSTRTATRITLGGATKTGLRPAARSCCSTRSSAPRDRGNHVLLEPDDTTDGYHVRAVTLDPSHRRARPGTRPRSLGTSRCPSTPPPCTPRAASSPSTPTAAGSAAPDAGRHAATRRWPPTAPDRAPRSGCCPRPSPSPSPTPAPSSSSRRASPRTPLPTRRVRPQRQPGARTSARSTPQPHSPCRWPTGRTYLDLARRRRQPHLPAVLHRRRLRPRPTTTSTSTSRTARRWTRKAPA